METKFGVNIRRQLSKCSWMGFWFWSQWKHKYIKCPSGMLLLSVPDSSPVVSYVKIGRREGYSPSLHNFLVRDDWGRVSVSTVVRNSAMEACIWRYNFWSVFTVFWMDNSIHHYWATSQQWFAKTTLIRLIEDFAIHTLRRNACLSIWFL